MVPGWKIYYMPWILLASLALDHLVGDPRSIPHPVVWMGRLISAFERILLPLGQRKGSRIPAVEQMAGVILAAVVPLVSLAAAWAITKAASGLHQFLGIAVSVWLISTTIAAKGLADAALEVLKPLQNGDLETARLKVGQIVGRDTHFLDEGEVTRAVVETVAENIVDAIVAPFLFGLLGGAPLAFWYRAVNTLDSMVGYKNDRYRYFGWASARLDDLANWIPARITGVLIPAAAWLRGYDARAALRIIRRDASKHPSPNSGIPEAGFAGALGVQLGGRNYYGGIPSDRARLGDPKRPLEMEDVTRAIGLMRTVTWLLGLLVLMAGAVSQGAFLLSR